MACSRLTHRSRSSPMGGCRREGRRRSGSLLCRGPVRERSDESPHDVHPPHGGRDVRLDVDEHRCHDTNFGAPAMMRRANSITETAYSRCTGPLPLCATNTKTPHSSSSAIAATSVRFMSMPPSSRGDFAVTSSLDVFGPRSIVVEGTGRNIIEPTDRLWTQIL